MPINSLNKNTGQYSQQSQKTCTILSSIRSTRQQHLTLNSLQQILENLTGPLLLKKNTFMEPEGTLPCSQGPTTGACCEQDKSITHPQSLLLPVEIRLNYLSIYIQVSQVVSSLQIFYLRFCINFSTLPRVLHAPSIYCTFMV